MISQLNKSYKVKRIGITYLSQNQVDTHHNLKVKLRSKPSQICADWAPNELIRGGNEDWIWIQINLKFYTRKTEGNWWIERAINQSSEGCIWISLTWIVKLVVLPSLNVVLGDVDHQPSRLNQDHPFDPIFQNLFPCSHASTHFLLQFVEILCWFLLCSYEMNFDIVGDINRNNKFPWLFFLINAILLILII